MAIPHDRAGSSTWIFSEPTKDATGLRVQVFEDGPAPPLHPKLQLCLDGESPLRLETFDRTSSSAVLAVAKGSALSGSLRELDAYVLEVAAQKCQEWFGKAIASEHLASMLQSPLSQGASRLTVSIGQHLAVWKLNSDGSYQEARGDDVQVGARVWPCVQVQALTFAQRHFSVALSLSDLLLLPPAQHGFPFQSSVMRFRAACSSATAASEGTRWGAEPLGALAVSEEKIPATESV